MRLRRIYPPVWCKRSADRRRLARSDRKQLARSIPVSLVADKVEHGETVAVGDDCFAVDQE